MSASPSTETLWSDEDWVSPSERRRGQLGSIIAGVFTLAGGAFYLAGIITITSLTGPTLFATGLVLFFITIVLTVFSSPYRRVTEVAPLTTVFHLSPAFWTEGETVTLEVCRCRKKQFIAERRRGRRSRLVYFFPLRPTRWHARGQTLAGKRRAPRYLYELKLLQPVERLYKRGSALGTPSDITAEVVRRQSVDA